jgi:hypothetical protein
VGQINFYVSQPVEDALRRRSDAAGVSLSKFVARLVQEQLKLTENGWPEGFFTDVLGSWTEDIQEPPDLPWHLGGVEPWPPDSAEPKAEEEVTKTR